LNYKRIFGIKRPALKIAAIYILIGALWVILTDELIGLITQDIERFVEYEILKASMFILVSGIILYRLILRDFRKIKQLHEERKRVIDNLQESEIKNRTLLNLIPDTIFRIDSKGIFLDSNITDQKNVYFISQDVIGKSIFDILPGKIADAAMMYVNKAIQTNQLQIYEFNMDIEGETRYYEARILSSQRSEVAVIVRDFTDKKKTEELTRMQQQQLVQADKMATLGIMVSGVAHEINNPNNYILLNGKIISRMWNDVMPILEEYHKCYGEFNLAGMPYTRAHKKIGKLIEGIPEGAQRIQQIVQTFKDFARQDTGELDQEVYINKVLDSSIVILNNLIKKSTDHFKVEYGKNIPAFIGNSQQIEQVIINLITNSCQALQGKEYEISVYTFHDKETDKVTLKVKDRGVGIIKQDIKYIFDPFFTSKRDSGGTGLGLSIVYKIIQNHSGQLTVKSSPGEGTTVRVDLPVAVNQQVKESK